MSVYKKDIVFPNIRWGLARQGIPLGVFETNDAQVQKGTTARWERPETETMPNLQYLLAAQEATGIGLDVLLGVDLTKLTPEAEYLIKFLEAIRADTINGKIEWAVEGVQTGRKAGAWHPLYRLEGTPPETEWAYSSMFDQNAKPSDMIYRASISTGLIYIVPCKVEMKEIIEMYMIPSKGRKEALCSTENAPEEVSKVVRILYETINAIAGRFSIPDGARRMMDEYMSERDSETKRQRTIRYGKSIAEKYKDIPAIKITKDDVRVPEELTVKEGDVLWPKKRIDGEDIKRFAEWFLREEGDDNNDEE